MIAANPVPDHSTIAEFRKRHEAAISGLFGEVLGLCRAAGMVNVLPEQLCTAEGRRDALKEAKRKLDRDRAAQRNDETGRDAAVEAEDEVEPGPGSLELDPAVIVARVQGRQGWLREPKRQLDTRREEPAAGAALTCGAAGRG